eukprot:TRINITY_DN29025_c0_g1_i1.p1 TRINITY_DN29025_c0_g1~~TRINITY_DN29025_c0_g1_i1.p1  ORF type:complete len:108 (-),score=19.26 TRINITY_DN29025_c0_g1_i1:300-623(-)
MAAWFGGCCWCKADQEGGKFSQWEDIQQLSALQAITDRLHKEYLFKEQEIWDPCDEQMFQIREKARRRVAELREHRAIELLPVTAAGEVMRPPLEPRQDQSAEWAHR